MTEDETTTSGLCCNLQDDTHKIVWKHISGEKIIKIVREIEEEGTSMMHLLLSLIKSARLLLSLLQVGGSRERAQAQRSLFSDYTYWRDSW